MGEDTKVSAKGGVGILLGSGGLTGPFPQDSTTFTGAEVEIDAGSGRLALMYYHGDSSDSFSQDSLPIGQELRDLFKFSSERHATTNFALAEWRWKQDQTNFMRPQIGLGVGAFHISTDVHADTTNEIREINFVMTGSAGVGIKCGRVTLGGGIRVFAGQAFGIMADTSIALAI